MGFRIVDTHTNDTVDILKVILLYSNRLSLLPELYDIFGKEALLKFLDIFAGMTIEVPSSDVIERAIRDTTIYIRLKRSTQAGFNTVVDALAGEYALETRDVVNIYRDVSATLEQNMGFKAILGARSKSNGKKREYTSQAASEAWSKRTV